ncbi:MAG: Heavy metal sensor histidine kinase [uncultured Caballeronia sp.]|nr:MAG: Heavy metal sensor histidine kinase [uncultured Caballeronia sp.]
MTGYERLLQFSANLAHEVRTPIGVLIGQTQVMLAAYPQRERIQERAGFESGGA